MPDEKQNSDVRTQKKFHNLIRYIRWFAAELDKGFFRSRFIAWFRRDNEENKSIVWYLKFEHDAKKMSTDCSQKKTRFVSCSGMFVFI